LKYSYIRIFIVTSITDIIMGDRCYLNMIIFFFYVLNSLYKYIYNFRNMPWYSGKFVLHA